jgi:hypothetical protein
MWRTVTRIASNLPSTCLGILIPDDDMEKPCCEKFCYYFNYHPDDRLVLPAGTTTARNQALPPGFHRFPAAN